MTTEAPILIDVGKGRLPGEISWWFLTPEHTASFADGIAAEQSLAHRVGMIYIGCLWHYEQGRVLPEALLRALAVVLDLHDIPSDAELSPAADQALETRCDAIIHVCDQRATQRALANERRRRAPEFQPLELRVALFRMICHFALAGVSTPKPVLTAMAHLLGLISWKDGRPLPSPEMLRLVGLPGDVDRLALFTNAARLDGAAIIALQSDDGFENLAAHLSRELSDGRWVRSCNALSNELGVARSTIRSWRSNSHYRRFAYGALMPNLVDSYWANYRRRYPPIVAI